MKLKVKMVIERLDGKHSGEREFEIDDAAHGNLAMALGSAMPIAAEMMDGIVYLIGHEDDDEVPAGFVGFNAPLQN